MKRAFKNTWEIEVTSFVNLLYSAHLTTLVGLFQKLRSSIRSYSFIIHEVRKVPSPKTRVTEDLFKA